MTGISPPSWKTVHLADVAEHSLGKMLDAKKNKGRPRPYLRNPNVRWFDVDTSSIREMPFEDHEIDRFGLRDGDVVICEGGEAGRAAIWDGRISGMMFQKAIHRVRPGPELDSRFLVHKLMADYYAGNLPDYYTGATIKHLTGQDLARYAFLLPPLPEQRRIAAVLDRAEALRAKRRAAILLLAELRGSTFQSIRGTDGHHQKGWLTTNLGDVATFVGGGTPSRDRPEFFSGSICWATSKDMKSDVLWDTEEHITQEAIAQSATKLVSPGTVLVVVKSKALANRLPVAMARVPTCFGQDLKGIIPSERVVGTFLLDSIRNGSRWLLEKARGINTEGLTLDHLRRFPLLLPPLGVQQEYASRVAAIESLKSSYTASLASLGSLFTSLQHRAFRGEL